MNITGGGLNFAFGATNKELLAVVNESKQAIQDFKKGVEQGGKDIDKAFTTANNGIRAAFAKIDQVLEVNHAEISKLKQQYRELGTAAEAALSAGRDKEYNAIQQQQQAIRQEISLRKEIIKEAEAQAEALNKETDALIREKEQAGNASQSHQSLQRELRQITQELAAMERNGQRGTEAYEALRKKAGQLSDSIADARRQIQIFSHDNQGLQGAISGLQGAVGAFTAAQGTVALFAGENENLSKIMLKVQSLMSITMGLQQVANTLNKDSAFMLTTVARAKQLLTVATTRLSVALGVSTVAAKALMATLTLGLSVAITAVITLISRLSQKEEETTAKTNEMRKAFTAYHQEVATKAANLVGTYQRLRSEYSKLSTEHEKSEWIKQNANEFKNLQLNVNNVTDADKVFINNTDNVVKALELRAKAMALQNLQMKAYEQYYKQTINADNSVKGGGFYSRYKGETLSSFSDEWKKAGVTMDDVTTNTVNQNTAAGSISTTTYTATQAAIDKVNAYRIQQASATNKKIHADAQAQLDKTLNYTKEQLELTEDEIKELNILNTQGNSNDPNKNNGSTKDADEYTKMLNTRKQLYEKYYKWVNSSDEIVRNQAKTEFAGLLAEGETYIAYLQNQRAQLLDVIGDSQASREQSETLAKLNTAIAEETTATVLANFDAELQRQLNGANSVLDKLTILEQKRKELESDTSGLQGEKAGRLDQEETNLQNETADSAAKAQQELQAYYTSKLNYEKLYLTQRKTLEEKINATTDEKRRRTYESVLASLEAAHTLKNAQDYDAMLKEYKSYEEKRAEINEQYAEKIRLAEENGNAELAANLIKERERALLANRFEELKGSPEYVRAFEDLNNTSSETLNMLLERMEEVKESVAANLNPEDLKQYTDAMTRIADELNSRNPFDAVKNGYKELKAAERELKQAEAELAAVRADGTATAEDLTRATQKANAAKDKYLQKSNQVQKAEKNATDAVKQLFGEITNVGNAIGGEAGEIISLIGDIGTFTLSAIQGFETASKASSTAIQTLEKASVILTVISAAVTFATKIGSLFAGDTKAYDKAKEAYEDYIAVLSDVIAKQKELVATLDGENALNSYKYALELVEKGEEAARSLGKQRLNAGKSSGFLGIGAKDSYGRRQKDNMDSDDWLAAYNALGWADYWQMRKGNMTGLFDLTVEQLEKLKSEAPTFWAKLDDDAREYLENIIASEESAQELKDTLNESLTGVSFDSLSDDFLSTLQDMDASAKDFAESFSEYMRKALIQNMFNTRYKSELEKYYQMWSDALNPDGDGGMDITEDEQNALNTLRDSIINGATEAAQLINEQFAQDVDASTLSGALATASQESIDLLAGQTNAVRQNQVTSIALLREQLAHLSNMDAGVTVIAERVLNILDTLKQSNSTDLRSQGITN